MAASEPPSSRQFAITPRTLAFIRAAADRAGLTEPLSPEERTRIETQLFGAPVDLSAPEKAHSKPITAAASAQRRKPTTA